MLDKEVNKNESQSTVLFLIWNTNVNNRDKNMKYNSIGSTLDSHWTLLGLVLDLTEIIDMLSKQSLQLTEIKYS